jgi:hypothetical protein
MKRTGRSSGLSDKGNTYEDDQDNGEDSREEEDNQQEHGDDSNNEADGDDRTTIMKARQPRTMGTGRHDPAPSTQHRCCEQRLTGQREVRGWR